MKWEDNLLERKLESDLKDILKTLVGFANTVKTGEKALLIIGESNDGTVQGVKNPENIQKKVREECDKIYPPITCKQTVEKRGDKYCVHVEVEYTDQAPHFGGPAWIRKGAETIKASKEIYQSLIEKRSGPVMELSKWIGKEITVQGSQPIPDRHSPRWDLGEKTARVVSVNSLWVTFEVNSANKTEPLKKLTLSYDDKQHRLKVFIDY
jgi:hypothetical protein